MCKNGKSEGPSGITNAHLKLLSHNKLFLLTLKGAFEQLLNNPQEHNLIPELFEFELLFL